MMTCCQQQFSRWLCFVLAAVSVLLGAVQPATALECTQCCEFGRTGPSPTTILVYCTTPVCGFPASCMVDVDLYRYTYSNCPDAICAYLLPSQATCCGDAICDTVVASVNSAAYNCGCPECENAVNDYINSGEIFNDCVGPGYIDCETEDPNCCDG